MSDDYYVRYVRFPNNSAGALAVVNEDGSYDIYINTRRSEPEQRRALLHELEHIRGGHFYSDLPVSAKEALARGEALPAPAPPPPPPRRTKNVQYFPSPAALAEYLRSFGELN